MLRQQDRGAQFPIYFSDGGQEIRGGDGVQLAGGLVQDQDGGLHGHDGGQVQELLLAPGKLCDILIEPSLYSEEGGHFRHPAADGGGIISQAFQAEGQLVPDFIRDDLILRTLLHEADAGALVPVTDFFQRRPLKQNLAAQVSGRSQYGLELPQQGRFPAAGRPAEGNELPLGDGKGKLMQRILPLFRIGKAQTEDRKRFHFTSSLLSRINGVRHRARYTSKKLTGKGARPAPLMLG